MTDRNAVVSFAIAHQRNLHLSADELNKMTVHDIMTKIKHAKLHFPSISPAPLFVPSASTTTPAGASSAGGVSNFSSSSSSSSSSPSLHTKNEEQMQMVLSDGYVVTPVVGTTNREQALVTMENIHQRISSARSKLHHQVEWRNRMSIDNDYDSDDIATFDACIKRTQSVLQQDLQVLSEKLNAYQDFLRRRNEKDGQMFQQGVGDEILYRDKQRKQDIHIERLSVLEKTLGGVTKLSLPSLEN